MANVYDNGPGWNFWPAFGAYALSGVTLTNHGTIDAAGESYHLVGKVYISDRGSSKSVSKIHWGAGTTTFANAGTTLRIGVQDVDATTGAPARGDGTFDVYDDFVGATDTITANAYNTATMSSGSKSLSHGNKIAIVFNLESRAGADSLGFLAAATPAQTQWPQVTVEAPDATFAAATFAPNAIIEFADGTWGWIYGSWVSNGSNNATFNSGSTPDEYCCQFTLTRPVIAVGLWALIGYPATAGPGELILYSDPAGTPAAVAGGTVTLDYDQRLVASSQRLQFELFPTPIELAAGTYAVAVRPTTADNITVAWITVADNNHLHAHPGGTSAQYGTRSNQSGSFALTATRRLGAGLVIGGGSDGAGGSGGLLMPNLRGNTQ